MNKPLQIGITGGIGSGKSFVCNIFRHLGVPVYDADTRAKQLMNTDTELKHSLIAVFGEETYNEAGLNRAYLADKVFNDSDKVKELNAIVHPAVGNDYKDWVEQNHQAQYVIKEAALMFESGSAKLLDKVIYIHAPEDLRISRVRKRDPQRSTESIRAIISKQLSAEEMRSKADFVIENDEDQMLLPQIIAFHKQFI